MFFKRRVEGLGPGRTYRIRYRVTIASNIAHGRLMNAARGIGRPPGSHELIAAAKLGDEGAARDLYRRHADRVRSAILRSGGGDELDDLCQEAWLRAFRHLSDFRSEADFGTWVFAIARNVALDWVRRRALHDARVQPIEGDPPTAGRSRQLDLGLDLQRALAELPSGMRAVLVLRAQGFTHKEVGAALRVAEGTSKSQLFKARAKLRLRITDAA